MKLKYAQVIGLNTDQKASQTILTSQDEENTFLAVLQLSSDDAFTRGRQTLAELSDFYFEFEGSPAQKLTATFDEASKKFQDAQFHLGLASISGKVLYIISFGEVVAFLKREGKVSDLLELGSPKQLISGFLNEGDRVMLASQSFSQILSEDLEKLLDLPLEEFEQDLSDRVGTLDSNSGELAALLVETGAEKQTPAEVNEDQVQSVSEEEPALTDESGLKPSLPVFPKVWGIFPKSGRSRLFLAIILMVIIGVGIGLKYFNDKNAQEEVAFVNLLQKSQEDFNDSKDLQSLNVGEAKLKLDSARKNLDEAIKIKPKDDRGQKLKEQIEGEKNSILQQFQAQSFPEFLDLNLVKKDFKAQNLALSGGKLLILDPTSKTLITLDLAKKSHQIQSGEDQLGEGIYSALSDNMAFVYSKDKGILRVDITNQKVVVVSKVDEGWGQIASVMPFASNVYLLDSLKNQIWKYVPTSEGYSDKREYLTKETKADFSNSLRLQIDSAVYVLKQNGEILKFLRGVKENFSFEGLGKGIKDPKSFFVSAESENLYILDSGNSRLLILTKTGSYKSQIEGEKFGSSSDLVVDEKGKKVYLLEGSKIYQVDLK